MKELKKEFRWFNIMEYEKEENYLSKRHQEGWKFKRVTFPGVYTFERCEPEKVIYQLDYNKEGIKHQMEYVRICSMFSHSFPRVMCQYISGYIC